MNAVLTSHLEDIFKPNRKFKFENKVFTVERTDNSVHKLYLYTDKRTFVFTESEYKAFVDKLEFVSTTTAVVSEEKEEHATHILPAQVTAVPDFSTLETGLMATFKQLQSGDEKIIPVAKQMVSIADAVCKIQLTKIATAKQFQEG